jgi:hypothetical protein
MGSVIRIGQRYPVECVGKNPIQTSLLGQP